MNPQEPAPKPEITYDDFAKLDLRVARVLEVQAHPNADKLLVLKVDLGPVGGTQEPVARSQEPGALLSKKPEIRQIIAGIRQWYPLCGRYEDGRAIYNNSDFGIRISDSSSSNPQSEIHNPKSLVGKLVIVVANLQPRKMRGLESNGMLLAASASYGTEVASCELPVAGKEIHNPQPPETRMVVILTTEKDVPPGSTVS